MLMALFTKWKSDNTISKMFRFRSDLITLAVVLVSFFATIAADGSMASLDSTAELLVVVTDGVNPDTGLCVDNRKSEDRGKPVDHQDFQRLLKEMISLLNDVIKENVNGRSRLALLEMTCDDGVDVIVEKITDLLANNHVTGVVTITRGDVADGILGVLQYRNVPVVEVLSTDVITRHSSRPNHFIWPHYTYWQITHAILAAEAFNWTALTISYQEESTRTVSAIADLFTSLAFKHGVCVLPNHLRSDVPTVIFQHDGDVRSALARTDAGAVLLVGAPAGSSDKSEYKHEQSVLHLYAQNADDRHLMKAIEVACNITSANSSEYSASQHGYDRLCRNSSSLNMATFGVKFYLESFFTSVSFLLNTSAVFMDPFPCNSSNVSLECLLSGSSEIMLDEKANVLYLFRNIFEVDYVNNNNSKSCDFKHIKYDTLIVPECVPSAVFNKNCGNVCDKCMKCFPSKFTDTNISTSGAGDAFVVAFFPIHMSTEEGFCDKPNPEGYLASLAFLETMKSYSSTLNVSGVQGVVFDSCASLGEVTSVLHSLETCKFYFKEEVGGATISRSFAESSIIGYVNGMNSFALPHGSKGKFNLHLHNFGYSTSSDFGHTFINNILGALSKIGWTVINVLVSDEEPFRTLSSLLDASSLSDKFCFVNQILIHADATLREADLNTTFRSVNQTPAFLLLTSLEDSHLVLGSLRRHAQYTTSKVSLAFTQWNLAFDVNQMLPYVDVIIKFALGVKNASQTMLNSIGRTVQSAQSVWSSEFRNVSVAELVISSQLAVVQGATEELLDALDVSYKTGANMGDLNIGPTRLKVSAISGDRNYETEIAYMDTASSVNAPYKGPSFSVCKGWCPACHAYPAKDTALATHLHLDGDILITGVFPLHQTGATAFSCGSPQSDVHKLLKVQSFMFAIETFKMRYPGLLPGLRIGGLVLDSCSNSATALKVIGDFETSTLNFEGSALHPSQDKPDSEKITETSSKAANPSTNVAYILDLNGGSMQTLQSSLKTAQLHNSIFMSSVQTLPQPASFQFIPAIIQILTNLGWDKIIIISGKPSEFQQEVKALISDAYTHNICVVATFQIESILVQVSSDLELYMGMPIVLLSSTEDSELVFDSLKDIKDAYFWIIPMYHKSWRQFVDKQDFFPLGSILIGRKSRENEAYNVFLQNLTTEPDFVKSLSSWFHDLWRLRFSCYFLREIFQELDKTQECPVIAPVSDENITSPEVYDAILYVDAVLHSLHAKYTDKCPNGYGICDQLAADMRNNSWSLGPNVTFDYQGEQLDYTFDGQPAATLSINSYQKDGVLQIGSYFKLTLTLNVTQIRFYSADGSELNTIPRAVCVSSCDCLVASPVNDTYSAETHPYMYETTGEFIDDLWAIIALAIGGCGALLSLIFAIYVVYKVTKKALGKRFVSLGLTLLFSVGLLYMTILPFLFTPSEAVCGLRYFLTGVSYTLCFAVVLVKLMSLQSYKLIGLGGEVSKTNQFLTTLFIVGVQIAIGVQWWLNNHPTMYSIYDSLNVQKYACNFNQREFVAYHAYVMLLILICCSYAICVRNEKKNLGEAKLLLTCSCTCVVIWSTWLTCLVLLDRKWSDAIICAGILSSATAVLLIIFVPKIRMVSRLKYDLSQKTNVRNGHSLDTDFLYERPYSLPGTLTSTFSSAKMNYPKTASSFDADVNY